MKITLKLEEKLVEMQEKLTDKVLEIISNTETSWEYEELQTNHSSCDGTHEYFYTPFRKGYIIIMAGETYYSLAKEDCTWCNLSDNSLFIGDYTVSCETYWKLLEIYNKSRFLED